MCADEIVSIIKDLCIAGAAVTTAYVAWRGVESWRSELKGRADFEIARNFMKSTYQLRDAIETCRSPWVSLTEFPEGYMSKSNPTADEKGEAELHVYSNRWKEIYTCIQQFDTVSIEAEALWGKQINSKGSVLRKCVGELKTAIDAVIRNAYSEGRDFESEKEYGKEMEHIVKNTDSENNQFTKKINDAISDIESYVRPHLSRN
ncbi:MAG: hypothetical protein AB2672_15750 [Candidatus Thiodiazotropha endolucinida]